MSRKLLMHGQPTCACSACRSPVRVASAGPASSGHKLGWPLNPFVVKVVMTAMVIAFFGSGVGGTLAVFTAATSSDGNTFTAGTVVLGDNDSGAAMLTLSDAKPGDSDTSCIRVVYTGSLPSTVRLYGTTTGTGLDPYLNLTVTRGMLPTGTFDDCSGFSADVTDYIGAGSGVIYSGTLQGFPDDYSTALIDPAAATPETWTSAETHDYMVVVTVGESDSGQGKTASQSFIWEARNI